MGQKGSKRGRRSGFERLLSVALSGTPYGLVWKRAGYIFKFAHEWEDCEFLWGGQRVYITSCEALHLYQRLVLGKKQSACVGRNALRRMRGRLGKGFLQEYLPHTQTRHWGRKSDLEREVDGSYYRYVFDKYHKGEK